MFGIFDLTFSKMVDSTIFVRDLFLFGVLRVRFFLCAGISVARHRQSTKSQVTAVSVNRGLRSASPRSRSSPEFRRAPVVHKVIGRRVHVARERRVREGRRSPRGKLPQRVGRSRTTRSPGPCPGNSRYQNCQAIVPMKNTKFGPSNAKFAKMLKSNA